MGSIGEFYPSSMPNESQNVQNMFVPNGFQAMPVGVPVNVNSYYQSSFTSNPNATAVTNFLPNGSQHSDGMPIQNPNPGNYVSNTIGSSASRVGFSPNVLPISNTVQVSQVTIHDSYPTHGAPLQGGNVVQAHNPFQMQQQSYSNYGDPLAGGNTVQVSNSNPSQQNYVNYGAPLAGGNGVLVSNATPVQQNYVNYGGPLAGGGGIQTMTESIPSNNFTSNGAPPTGSFMSKEVPPLGNAVVPTTCNNTMVENNGNFQNGSFTATDNYSTSFQPVAGKECMQYGDPSAWNMGVQNSYQAIGATSQTNGFQESHNYSQANVVAAVVPMTLQREWEPYQASLNQDKIKTISDREVVMQPTFSGGCRTTPCANFFSTYGCSNGENCQFSHYVPGGVKSSGFSGPVNGVMGRDAVSNVPGIQGKQFPVSVIKTKLCTRYLSPEGCKFGEKCYYAHGESNLRIPSTTVNAQIGRQPGQMEKLPVMPGNSSTPFASQSRAATFYNGEPSPPGVTVTKMRGATSFAKLAIDAAHVGAIIGKAGSHIKEINRASGCKVSIREHGTSSGLRNVEMEGSPEQIEKATELVRQLLQQKDAGVPKAHMVDHHTFKTRLCENFSKGVCTYGDRCLFAHGPNELRTAGR